MEELEITISRVIRIWWSLVWRMGLYSAVAGFLVGLPLGMVLAAWGMGPERISIYGQFAGILVSIPVGIWVVHIILNKQFAGFRLALLPSAETMFERLDK